MESGTENREVAVRPQAQRSGYGPGGGNGMFYIEDEEEAEEMQMTQEWLRIQQRRMIQSRGQPQIRLVTYRTLRPYTFGPNYGA